MVRKSGYRFSEKIMPQQIRARAAVAQLVRAPDCGSGGRWFESTQLYQRIAAALEVSRHDTFLPPRGACI
jgi:hypothetical protein